MSLADHQAQILRRQNGQLNGSCGVGRLTKGLLLIELSTTMAKQDRSSFIPVLDRMAS
jgi:hypothetical protein